MKLSSFVIAVFCTAVAVVVLLLALGASFHRPVPAQGARLYDPKSEVTLQGTVTGTQDFACPVSENEVESHLLVRRGKGVVQVHLAPGRIVRSHHILFAAGDPVTVMGSQVRLLGNNDIIAREITRANEQYVFRDATGELMLVQ